MQLNNKICTFYIERSGCSKMNLILLICLRSHRVDLKVAVVLWITCCVFKSSQLLCFCSLALSFFGRRSSLIFPSVRYLFVGCANHLFMPDRVFFVPNQVSPNRSQMPRLFPQMANRDQKPKMRTLIDHKHAVVLAFAYELWSLTMEGLSKKRWFLKQVLKQVLK